MAEEPSLSYYLPIAGGRIIGFIPFPRVLVVCEMQPVSSRIWTRVAVFISYGDNDYTTGTLVWWWGLKSHAFGIGNRSFFSRLSPAVPLIICHCFPPDRTWHKVNDKKVNYSWDWEKGKLGLSWDLNPAGLYWSSLPTQRWPSQSQELFSLKSVLDFEHCAGPKPGCPVNFWLLPVCLYSISHCYSTGREKYFCTQEIPL